MIPDLLYQKQSVSTCHWKPAVQIQLGKQAFLRQTVFLALEVFPGFQDIAYILTQMKHFTEAAWEKLVIQ